MQTQNLKRVRDEIKTALDTAKAAEDEIEDTGLLDADTFKQIARPLRRALRLVSEQPTKPARDEADASLLFNLMNSGDGDVAYEVGCILDEEINAAARVYEHQHFFTLMYLDAIKEGKGNELKFILRELKKGTAGKAIAQHLKEGGLRRTR